MVATAKKVEYHGKLMDERYVTVDIDSPVRLDLTAGDYMIYRGDKFTLRDSSEIEKCARPQSYGGAFIYKDLKLVAQSWQELYDTEMTDYVYHDNDMHYTGLGTFSFYMTKVSDMGYRVQAVMDNKYGAGKWVVMIGGVALTDNYTDVAVDDAKSISISSGTSVKDTLNMLWTEWGYYYKVSSSIVNNELVHYVDLCPSTGTTLPLYYGKKRTEVVAGQSKEVGGLVKIVRKINTNVEICTRVRAYGSERNLPYHWYNNKYGDQTNPYDPLRSMYIPQLMLPHIALYYDEDGNYCDADGDLYEQGDDAVVNPNNPIYPWSSPNDVVLENVVTSALFGKRDKEVHWNSEDMGEIFPSMKGMKANDVTGLQTKTFGNQGSLDRILSFSYESSGDTGSSLPADVTSDKMNFIVYVPNPGFNPTDHNTSDNVELLVQSGMCQARAFTIIKSEGCDTNGEPVTDGTGTVVQYKLTCAKIIDEEIDQVFPNSPYFEIGAGDYYVYTGLEFNGDYSQDTWLDVYVRAAEMRLLRAAALWLREHSREDYIHEVSIDNLYMKTMPNISANLVEGASVKITDNNIGSDKTDIVESVTITEGKEAIPTYDVTFLRRDESESLGDRVKGLVGQTISASSEIAKANDSLARKVNVANLMELLTPLAADGTTAIAWNQATLQNTHYLRANVDFFGVSGVSALGIGSGGGGSASLNALLASLNGSTIGNVAPTIYEDGKCPVWIQTTENNGHWEWGTTGGEGGGVTLREPLSSINSASLGTPTESGQVITWNGSHWIYAIPQGGGGGDDDDTYLENITYWSDNENDSTYLENIVYWGNSEDDASFLNNITYWGKGGGSTPSYSFDEAAMWAALGTNETTKIIDDSHISATIRNGAAAGATAIQQSDLNTALGSYLTKTEANGLFVHLTGNVNETITGVKTFSNDIVATRIKIGNAYISYNSNGLCIDDGNGGSMNLYATGGVSSLGVGSSGGGGVSSLSELSDVNISSPIDGQGLVYDSATQKWVNGTVGGGGGGGISLADVWTSLAANNTSNKIHFSHLPNTIHVVDALHVDQSGHLENYNGAIFDLPDHSYRSTPYTLATTEDIQNVDLTGYATESWVEGKNYLTGNQRIDLTGDVSGGGTTSIYVQIGTGKVTNDMLYGNIANNKLSNSSITIAGETVTLGGSILASTLLTKVQSDFDGRYVTLGTSPQTISATKTFTARQNMFGINLDPNGDIRETLPNNGGTFYLGYNAGGGTGFNLSYSSDNENYTYLISGLSNGNVGIGNRAPEYKFDVNGNIHTNSAYYLDGRLFANNDTNNNTGLHIGYEYAVDDSENPSPLPTTLWGEGISFRSAGGTYGGCTKIDDTHGNITYGIMATDFIGVTNKFRFEYDLQNNTVWVLKADGSAVHFASLGGVSSLGISSSGTPNISSMNIATLTATTATAATLNVSTINPTSSEISILTPDQDGGYVTFNCEKDGEEYYFTDFYNVGLYGEDNNGETWSIEPDGSAVFASSNIGSLKVGSNGSYISRMYWDGTYLQVTVGGAIRYFKPETI